MTVNFDRRCSLTLTGNSGRTIVGGGDRDLRFTFSIKQWDLQSPNTGDFIIYNPSKQTVAQFQNKEFQHCSFSAGYRDNVGPVFDGTILQTIYAHENATDTYLQVRAASGGTGYQQARVTKTLAAGYTPMDEVDVALKAMEPFGISLGLVNVDLSQPRDPRGTVLVGMARDTLRHVAISAGAQWSIQNNGKLHIVDQRRPMKTSTVKLTAATGLVGWPKQEEAGLETISLLNPRLQPHVNIELDPSQIITAERELVVTNPGQAQRNVNLDSQGLGEGIYNIFYMTRQGDTRGAEWYDRCLSIGASKQVNPSVAYQGYYTQGQN